MSDQVKACKVLAWDPEQKQDVWQAAWFYGLKEIWTGTRQEVKAVVRFPGSLLLEEQPLAVVKLVEDSDPVEFRCYHLEPTEEAELEEELKRTQERLARLRGILVQVHNYLTNYQGSGLSEGVAEDLCKILDYPDPIMEDK